MLLGDEAADASARRPSPSWRKRGKRVKPSPAPSLPASAEDPIRPRRHPSRQRVCREPERYIRESFTSGTAKWHIAKCKTCQNERMWARSGLQHQHQRFAAPSDAPKFPSWKPCITCLHPLLRRSGQTVAGALAASERHHIKGICSLGTPTS